MSEPLIYRPNSFSPEAWDALTRDEQIEWWKNQTTSTSYSSGSPLRVVQLYERGVYSMSEVPFQILTRLTQDNVFEFFKECPRHFIQFVAQVAAELPKDDDDIEWEQLRFIHAGSYDSWVTSEEIELDQSKIKKRIRTGTKIFRNAVTKEAPSDLSSPHFDS